MMRGALSLEERLADQGIRLSVSGESGSQPWFVRAMLAFCAWLASLSLIAFVAAILAQQLESVVTSTAVGIVLILTAFGLYRAGNGDFVEQLSLPVSLAGQAYLVWAAAHWSDGLGAGFWWVLTVLWASLALIMPGFLHRVLTTFFMAIALTAGLAELGESLLSAPLLMLLMSWCWLHEFQRPGQAVIRRAIGLGAALGLVLVECGGVLGNVDPNQWLSEYSRGGWLNPALSELLKGLVFFYGVWGLVQRLPERLSRVALILTLTGSALLILASLQASGLLAAFLILLLGFGVGHRVMMALGLAAVLFYVSAYYYQLHLTLLEKALALAALGGTLLLLSLGLRFFHKALREAGDA